MGRFGGPATPVKAKKVAGAAVFGADAVVPSVKVGKPPGAAKKKAVSFGFDDVDYGGTFTSDVAGDRKAKHKKAPAVALLPIKTDGLRVRQASIIRAMTDMAHAQNGSPFLLVGDQTKALHIGVPMYAGARTDPPGNLPMEYFFGMNVFPLGLVIVILGPPKNRKSSLAIEFMRWFDIFGGTGRLIEVESKHSPELVEAILQEMYREGRFQYTESTSVEGWQHALIRNWETLEKLMSGKEKVPGMKGPIGYSWPHVDVVDTIYGKSSAEAQAQVEEDGAAGRAHPVHALSIAGFLRAESHKIRYAPLSLVFVNQQKRSTDDRGMLKKESPGGKSVQFQEAIEIELTKIADIPSNAQFEGQVIKLSMLRSSLRPEREIKVRVLVTYIKGEDGEYREICWFDWYWATVDLLVNLPSLEKKALADEGFHIAAPTKSDVQNRAWSKTLGMSEKEAVPWSQLGKMIHERPDVMDKLRKALFIAKRNVMEGDFRKQQNTLLRQAGSKFTADEIAKRAQFAPTTSKKAKKKAFAQKMAAQRKAESEGKGAKDGKGKKKR